MFCLSCGAKLSDFAKFCPYCGAQTQGGTGAGLGTGPGTGTGSGAFGGQTQAPDSFGSPDTAPTGTRIASESDGRRKRRGSATGERDGEHRGLGAQIVQFRHTALAGVPTFALVVFAIVFSVAAGFAVGMLVHNLVTNTAQTTDSTSTESTYQKVAGTYYLSESGSGDDADEDADDSEYWTMLSISSTGKVSADYLDLDSDEKLYWLNASLGEPELVSEYVWKAALQLDEDEDIQVYGLIGASELTIYLEGCPVSELPEGYEDWAEAEGYDVVKDGVLTVNVIYNETDGLAFVPKGEDEDAEDEDAEDDASADDTSTDDADDAEGTVSDASADDAADAGDAADDSDN